MSGALISALVVACSSDDTDNGGGTNTNDAGPGTDANNTTDSGNTDSGSTDSGPQDSGPQPIPAKLQLVNAATDLGPNDVGALRVCFKVGPDADHLVWASLPPLPNRNSAPDTLPFPGLFIGTGGTIPGTGVDFSTLLIRPYIFSAQSLAQKSNLGNNVTAGHDQFCGDIVDTDAGGALTPGTDYWQLPDVPAQTLLASNSYILTLTGCSGNSTLGTDKCGQDFSSANINGNLKVNVFQVDNKTTVDGSSVGTQFANYSPLLASALAAAPGGTLTVRPAYITDKDTPSTAKPVSGPTVDAGTSADVAFQGTTPLVQVSGVAFATDSFTANANAPDLAIPLAQIEQLTFGTATPASGALANGKSFTFIALGDPTQPSITNQEAPDGGDAGPGFNFYSLHYIALPNDPVITSFDPQQ